VPLVAAGGLYLVRADTIRVLPTIAYVGALVTLTGSHVITVVWGSTFLLVVAAISCFALGGRLGVSRRRLSGIVALSAASVGVNLWWLLPAFVYRHHVLINTHSSALQPLGGGSQNRAAEIFDPLRSNNLGPPPILAISPTNAKVPVVAALWALLALGFGWRTLGSVWRRVALGLMGVAVVLLALVMFHQPWLVVPSLWRNVQFVIRLQTYITLAVMGLVVIGALAMRTIGSATIRRALTLGLVAVGALTGYQAYKQVWTLPSVLPSRGAVFANEHAPPPSWYAEDDYADVAQPVVSTTLGVVPGLTESNGQLSLPLAGPPRSSYAFRYISPKPGTVWTNILGGPRLVNISGGKAVGRTSTNWMIVALPGPAGKPSKLVFSGAHPWPVKLGIAGSVVSVLGLGIALIWLGVNGMRRRRRGTLDSPSR